MRAAACWNWGAAVAEAPPPVVLFAGPSTHGIAAAVFAQAGVQVRPPVRRGDVPQLVASAARPGVLIVCDGVFQVAPAVGHAELCGALDAGWQVWGVSSIGAIRAHELRAEGMCGFGRVFAMFSRFDDFTDDELCLLHFPEAPWFPVSEALVNLRHALQVQGPALDIAAAGSQAVIDALRALWFGDRTHERIHTLLCSAGGCHPAQADALLSWLAANRLKTLDLLQLLQMRPWLARAD